MVELLIMYSVSNLLHYHTDDKVLWDWAVVHDEEVWTAHGQAVKNTGMYVPGSFDCKLHNIAEKINMDYKTWEFHLYTFGLTPALLYDILPECYWANFCKLVHGIQIMSQYTINKQDLKYAYVLLCTRGCSPSCNQDNAQGPSNLLCAMGYGVHRRQPQPGNMAAIETL